MPCAIPDHLIAAYREEAAELIGDLETALIGLGRAPGDADLVDRALRALHTLKGSAAMFGFDELADLAPEVSKVLEAVRDGWVRVTPGLIALTMDARAVLRSLLDRNGGAAPAACARLVAGLRANLPTEEALRPAGPPLPPPTPPPEGRKTYRLRFRPHADLFRNGTNALGLLGELRTLGRYEAVARSDTLPRLEDLSPEVCHLGWDVILTTDRGLNAVLDAFTFVDGRCELKVEVVDDARDRVDEPDPRLGDILVDRGEVSAEDIDRILIRRQRIGELLAAEGLVSTEAVQAAMVEQRVVREERQRRDGSIEADGTGAVRVTAARLDRLCALVSRLVIAQARLTRLASRCEDPELVRTSQEIEQVLAELRDGAFELRDAAQA